MTISLQHPEAIAVSGVHGLWWEDRVRFFTLGSISRGIPRREWDIPLKDIETFAFTFYPRANVVAIAGSEDEDMDSLWSDRWKIQLRTLSDGEPHPSAQTADLCYTFEPESAPFDGWKISITSSRLALLLLRFYPTEKLIVWDWTTGEILLARWVFLSYSPLTQILRLGPGEQGLQVCGVC